MNLKHWLKIDHISFFLIAPSILLDLRTVALLFWVIAFGYDLYETMTGKEK